MNKIFLLVSSVVLKSCGALILFVLAIVIFLGTMVTKRDKYGNECDGLGRPFTAQSMNERGRMEPSTGTGLTDTILSVIVMGIGMAFWTAGKSLKERSK